MKYVLVYKGSDLMHHGVKGQKWGVRRYQNADGTLTDAGKRRLNRTEQKLTKYGEKASKYQRKADTQFSKANRKQLSIISSRSSIERSLGSAENKQRRANYYYSKGARYFEKNQKFFKNKLSMDLSEDSIRLGKELVDKVRRANELTYASIDSARAFNERNSRERVRMHE